MLRNERKLLTVKEAARYTGLSVHTLYSWIWQKRVPYIKLGRAVRFDVDDLDRLIQLQRVEPESKLLPHDEELPHKRG
jgi:excisionase family DNA binding protein